jgi:predicted 3-demethylubiquinone-9 3-methyltransferase (glyoxalase superfamily)
MFLETPCLSDSSASPIPLGDDQAEMTVDFYISVFDSSRIVTTIRYDKQGTQTLGRPKGSRMKIDFQLDGQNFEALNGAPVQG